MIINGKPSDSTLWRCFCTFCNVSHGVVLPTQSTWSGWPRSDRYIDQIGRTTFVWVTNLTGILWPCADDGRWNTKTNKTVKASQMEGKWGRLKQIHANNIRQEESTFDCLHSGMVCCIPYYKKTNKKKNSKETKTIHASPPSFIIHFVSVSRLVK